MRWPILRLTTPEGGGHDYWEILNKWTLPMVLRVNEALDAQAKANRLGVEKARAKEGQNGFR
jgi:hypothetical protein